ncbi:MAG: hypothetical protein LKE37_02640 [Atopobiaceae bacterium]|jgi:hippurate hydrolase|nr:hypothetical protein [Atopobiaceae bacterium]
MASEATSNQASCRGDAEVVGRLTTDRRALHRIPEISFDLPRTIAYVEAALVGLPCVVERPCRSCVTAFFDFGQPSSVGFRCDMDALPVSEATGRDFASEIPGSMHACGHDGHMADHARDGPPAVARRGPSPERAPRIPACGGGPGGRRAGVRERHPRAPRREGPLRPATSGPTSRPGHVETRVGPFLASCGEFDIDVSGKAAHAAHQDEGVDALAPACRIACRVGELAEGRARPGRALRRERGAPRRRHHQERRSRGVPGSRPTMRTFRPESRARLTAGYRARARGGDGRRRGASRPS